MTEVAALPVADDVLLTPTRVIAMRVRELRDDRGWSAADLARAMRAAGVPWERGVVIKLEAGYRQSVSVVELLTLAAVLDVAVVHLLVPPYPSPLWGGEGNEATDVARSPDDPNEPNDDAPYQVTPGQQVPAWRVRQFVRGHRPLPGQDVWRFFGQVPPQERIREEDLAKRAAIGDAGTE